MPIRFRLTELMRQWEHLNGEEPGSLTYKRLSGLTGIGVANLNKIGTNKSQRIDNTTLDRLLNFFQVEANELIERADERGQ